MADTKAKAIQAKADKDKIRLHAAYALGDKPPAKGSKAPASKKKGK